MDASGCFGAARKDALAKAFLFTQNNVFLFAQKEGD